MRILDFKSVDKCSVIEWWYLIISVFCVGYLADYRTMEYSSIELKDINRLSQSVLPNNIIARINQLDIEISNNYKPAPVRRRGGRKVNKSPNDRHNAPFCDWSHNEHQFDEGCPIPTRITTNYRKKTSSRTVSQSNLTPVNIISDKKDSFAPLTIGLFNSRSVKNKEFALHDLIIDRDFDILCLTETWLDADARTESGLLTPTGYSFVHKNRDYGRGGGVALVHKSALKYVKLELSFLSQIRSFEVITGSIKLPHTEVKLFNIYRPPPSSKNGFTDKLFYEEFSEFLSNIVPLKNVLILGDFNVHIENDAHVFAASFKSLLSSFGFKQHISEPTHTHGHTLDLLITHDEGLKIHDISVFDPCLSDHKCVLFTIPDSKPQPIQEELTYRNRKSLNLETLRHDIGDFKHAESDSVSVLAKQYNDKLSTAYDKNVPEVTKTVILRPNTQWFNDMLRHEKVIRRRLERKYVNTGLDKDEEAYKKQCQRYNHLSTTAKTDFLSNKVIENSDDKKKLFKITKSILNWQDVQVYPSGYTNLPDKFSDYFVDKIVKIQNTISQKQTQIDNLETLQKEVQEFASESLHHFRLVTDGEIRKIISNMSNASCNLDPLPADLLKQCLNEILPFVTEIVNLSLKNADVPRELKVAIVKPLIKKMSLNPEEFKNYRPVSNLSFLSKIIEKVVSLRLLEHLESNNLCEPMQSAYRRFHSTETALIKIQNDLLRSLDKRQVCALVLLDLSAAFDTVSHKILLGRLESRFGIHGSALGWFNSYLSGRSQYVKIKDSVSNSQNLSFGIPQGSILGPILFTLYISPLGNIARSHGLGNHFYADDSQLYLALENSSSKEKLELCISDYREWMTANNLKINEVKTEIVLIGSRYNLKNRESLTLSVGSQDIKSSKNAGNLGVIFDSELTMSDFVNRKCASCMYYIKSISKIRKFLTKEATQSLIQAYVVSRLDYCNSLLYGVSKQNINKLQKVQNAAARVILKVNRSTHMTPILKTLHWLPIQYRIQYKILVTTFNALHGNSPNYISHLLEPYNPTRSLRSRSRTLLQECKVNNSYGSRAFSSCGPKLFNMLPEYLKQSNSVNTFKKDLKTFLFKEAFKNVP